MSKSAIKKLFAYTLGMSFFVSLFFLETDTTYFGEVGSLIHSKSGQEEISNKQHSLDLQKMRPTFSQESTS